MGGEKMGIKILGLVLFAMVFPQEHQFGQEKFSLFAGIEIIELAQNNFGNLGADNYTFFCGFSLPHKEKTFWGLRYNTINVELSETHLKEPSPFFKGDFSGVTGNLGVRRLYADYYYKWDLGFLSIQPIASLSLGYSSWGFINSLTTENYDLKTFSVGLSGRFRFTLLHYFFVEIPALDVFIFLYKNRSPEGFIGDAHIAFNELGGAFNWIFLGLNVPFN